MGKHRRSERKTERAPAWVEGLPVDPTMRRLTLLCRHDEAEVLEGRPELPSGQFHAAATCLRSWTTLSSPRLQDARRDDLPDAQMAVHQEV